MRKINKQESPSGFNGSKFNNNCSNWSDFHKYHKDKYEESRLNILNEEQNQLCGYTELYIKELEDCHIDHYKKRSMFPQLTFKWENLIVATKDDAFGAKYKDNSAGIQANDYNLFFNPVIDNVEQYFYYNKWGGIEPISDISDELKKKVIKTIEVFKLDHDSLEIRRKNYFKILNSYVSSNLNKGEIINALKDSGFKSLLIQELN